MNPLATQYRTHTCGELRESHADAGESATLAGHVDRRAGAESILVRDRYGKTLCTVADGALPYVADRYAKLGLEDVVQVRGKVARRAPGDVDADQPAGAVELKVDGIEILCSSAEPPRGLLTEREVPLDDRLAFRQLYLRRPDVQKRLGFRAEVVRQVREFLLSRGFLEIETPHLFWYDKVARNPEPVPVENGKAFALPSGSVVLNQYIKPGGFDRFFQFLRVTRREANPTPAHQQEHTLLDLNMAYVDVADFCRLVEDMLAHVFQTCLGTELKTPFPTIAYGDALARYGSDRPDMRFGLEIQDLPEAAPAGQACRAIRVPAALARALSDSDLADAASGGALSGGALWLRVVSDKRLDGTATPLFTDPMYHDSSRKRPALLAAAKAGVGDALFVAVAPTAEAAGAALGPARARIASTLEPAGRGRHEPVWITDYPFLEDDEGNLVPRVVVFSAAADADYDKIIDEKRRGEIRARAFDLVLDGVEIASAYIGNHNLDVQRIIWQNIFGMANADLVRLRAPIEAHRFGVPPHGGMNIGFDRLVARLLEIDAIDEVMAFPKSPLCRDPLLAAPAPVPPEVVEALVADAPDPAFKEEHLAEEVVKS